jgi:ribosome-associated toxin RatA of RatAB toxin-antitoxin module
MENGTHQIIGLIIAATVILASSANAQGSAPEISFSVTRDGEFIKTDARVDLPVAPSLAWSVLTDYERYPHFISSMSDSKIASRSPEGLVVEQKGELSFLFFSQGIEVRLLVSEFPPNVIESRAIGGDFRVMTGHYELLRVEKGVRLTFSGRLVSKFALPPVFGLSIVHYLLLRNFREMVDEMLRRDSAARREDLKAIASSGEPLPVEAAVRRQ